MISVYTLENFHEWDHIVKSFKEYDVYYLSSYVKLMQLHGDGQPLLFYYKGKDTRAINVVMKRRIPGDISYFNKEYYDFLSPYNYGGFLIEGSDYEGLRLEYQNYCRENDIVSEFVRFHPLVKNAGYREMLYDVSCLGKTIVFDLDSEDALWSNIGQMRKKNIKKARNSRIEVKCGMTKELVDQFLEIYYSTMDYNNATSYYYFEKEFFYGVMEELSEHAIFFYAVYENEIIAMQLVLYSNKKISGFLCGSLKEYNRLNAISLVYYEMALWGVRAGYEKANIGGGLGYKEDSLYQYKSSFNVNSNCSYYVGKQCYNNEIYSQLVEKRKSNEKDFDENSCYFPLYRS